MYIKNNIYICEKSRWTLLLLSWLVYSDRLYSGVRLLVSMKLKFGFSALRPRYSAGQDDFLWGSRSGAFDMFLSRIHLQIRFCARIATWKYLNIRIIVNIRPLSWPPEKHAVVHYIDGSLLEFQVTVSPCRRHCLESRSWFANFYSPV